MSDIEDFMVKLHQEGLDVQVTLDLNGVWSVMAMDGGIEEASRLKFASGGTFAHAVRSYGRAAWQIRFSEDVEAGKQAILGQMRKRKAIENADA
jgi:hypothetical protein